MPGFWFRTAPFFRIAELPHWRHVRPLLLTNGAQFRPTGPPAINSVKYAIALQEVARLGSINSKYRTAEQAQVAKFWSDFSYTETPVGHWNTIARQVAEKTNMAPAEVGRLFGMLNVAMSDAGIACWDSKMHFNFWRPITAIQMADEDANPKTEADPTWLPFLNTPNHPEYVSGHAVFSRAAAEIITHFLPTHRFTFNVSSDTLPSVSRTYSSLLECANECAESRIWGGIHYRFSCDDGQELGKKVAQWTTTHFDAR